MFYRAKRFAVTGGKGSEIHYAKQMENAILYKMSMIHGLLFIQKGETAMKKRKNTGLTGKKWLAVLLTAVLLLASCALAEDGLEGYSKEKGYTYLLLGRYPQTAEGGI